MHRYFTRERFGRPQLLAGLLLLAFLGQALWLVGREFLVEDNSLEALEALRISAGWRQWHGRGIAGAPYSDPQNGYLAEVSGNGFDRERSPLLPLVAAAPLLPLSEQGWTQGRSGWRWLPRLPFLACGVLLGASLWYVARRLGGNTGGFIALTFYCFSPSLIQASAVWHTEPEIVVAWGAFGTIFTAIAVAHTLYAPREVVLWNWRRILLLGVALVIAVGSQFSMIIVVPIVLGFLLYLAPVRRQAGLVIWLAACILGLVMLFAVYFFHPRVLLESLQHAVFFRATWRAFTVAGVYRQVAAQTSRACPALVLSLPVAVATYALWPRTRYFGNTAPLLVAALFVILGIADPHAAGRGFLLASVPFFFVFVSGVAADLLETRNRRLMAAAIVGMMAAYVVWSLFNLAQIPPG
jgi:hypothetical protein